MVLSTAAGHTTETLERGAIRFPIHLNAPITRWRLHIRNYNDRFRVAYDHGAQFTGLWLGEHQGKGRFTGPPQRIADPFVLPEGGVEHITPWFSEPLGGNTPRLLSAGWTGAIGPNTAAPAGCFRSHFPERAGQPGRVSYRRKDFAPFSWWLEVEVPRSTQAVSMWGDSIASGTGNHLVIHDSPLAQHCRSIGAIPVHHSYPGTGMVSWTNPQARLWRRWSHLSRVDSVVHFMGHNDLNGGATADTLRQRFQATLPLLRRHVSPRVYVASLLPSSGKSEAANRVRQEHNLWLSTVPHGALGFLDFSAAVSTDAGDALLPDYDCGDHLHLSTAGSDALAAVLAELTRH